MVITVEKSKNLTPFWSQVCFNNGIEKDKTGQLTLFFIIVWDSEITIIMTCILKYLQEKVSQQEQ